MEQHPVERLIQAIGESRQGPSDADVRRVREHVAQAGFDPAPTARAGGRLAGLTWKGRNLTGTDRLTSSEVHFLRHVVYAEEWPAGTTIDAYLASIKDTVLDPDAGIFVSYYYGQLQVGFVRRSGTLRGSHGRDWLLVEYRVGIGHWVTAYQIDWESLFSEQRIDLRWLRPPR